MLFPKIKKLSTFLKYLLSYILVFTVLMAAFFLILRSQLTEAYRSQRTARVLNQMEAIRAHLSEEIKFLNQTDAMITENSDIRLANYRTDSKYYRITDEELRKYAKSSSLINSIVYYSRYSGHVFSTVEYTTCTDGVFTFTNSAGKQAQFDPAPYMDADSGQLIWHDDGQMEYLFYFPKNQTAARFIYFYILDTRMLQSQMMALLSEEVPAVALLDTQGNYVTGSGFVGYIPSLEGISRSPGVQPLSDSHSLFLSDELYSGLHLAAVVSEDYLTQQVDSAFLNSVVSLLGLSLLGIGLVYVAMLFTYRPLQRLVKSLGHETGGHRRYLDLLSENYSELNSQKAQLEQTLAQYRESLAQYRQRRAYPHEDLEKLSDYLKGKAFSPARELVESLLTQPEGNPDYFHTCIVLDCLTMITNSMGQAHIKFETYRDVFTEAVHQCREIPHNQNLEALKSLINELLFFYEREAVNKLLHITPLRKMVEANFCDPGFSISTIARTYHVSDSRMSTLFKEEMGIGFTDCIWQMRLKKARELLRDTELSVDEISLRIGYLTPNSFRRKFKQETGMTPSQYRAQGGIAE